MATIKKFICCLFFVSLIIASCDYLPNSKASLGDDSNQPKDSLDSRSPTVTLVSSLPRFQIIQSTIAARGTYKLDTYKGEVFQMVMGSDNNETWQLLRKYGHENADAQVLGHKNYELFTSTIAMKFTYLINVNTGSTWQLVQDPNSDEIYFSAIK